MDEEKKGMQAAARRRSAEQTGRQAAIHRTRRSPGKWLH